MTGKPIPGRDDDPATESVDANPTAPQANHSFWRATNLMVNRTTAYLLHLPHGPCHLRLLTHLKKQQGPSLSHLQLGEDKRHVMTNDEP